MADKRKICSNPECLKAGELQPIENYYRRYKDTEIYHERCKVCVLEKQRETHARRMKEDPEYVRRKRIQARENAALRRRAQGLPQRAPYKTMRGKPVEGGYHQSSKRTRKPQGGFDSPIDTVDSHNFTKWLLVLIRQHGGVVAVAKKAGVDEALIRRHAYPKKDSEKRVTLTLVDRVATAMGSHLSLIYPDEN